MPSRRTLGYCAAGVGCHYTFMHSTVTNPRYANAVNAPDVGGVSAVKTCCNNEVVSNLFKLNAATSSSVDETFTVCILTCRLIDD